MPSKGWFSFRWFLLGFLVALLLFLVGVPLCTSNTRDARGAEGEQMLGSMKGYVRLAFARSEGRAPTRLTGAMGQGGCGVQPAELQGKYFMVLDHVSHRGPEQAAVFALPKWRKTSVVTHEFRWDSGDGTFEHNYGGGR